MAFVALTDARRAMLLRGILCTVPTSTLDTGKRRELLWHGTYVQVVSMQIVQMQQ